MRIDENFFIIQQNCNNRKRVFSFPQPTNIYEMYAQLLLQYEWVHYRSLHNRRGGGRIATGLDGVRWSTPQSIKYQYFSLINLNKRPIFHAWMALSKQPVFRSGRQLSRHNGTSRRNLTPLEPSPALHENKVIYCARLGQHIPYQTLPVTYTGAGLPGLWKYHTNLLLPARNFCTSVSDIVVSRAIIRQLLVTYSVTRTGLVWRWVKFTEESWKHIWRNEVSDQVIVWSWRVCCWKEEWLVC